MFGFGGPNAEPWLDFFDRHSNEVNLTYISKALTTTGTHPTDFPHVQVVDLRPNGGSTCRGFASWVSALFKFLRHAVLKRYDVLILQGLYDPRFIRKLLWFSHSKRFFVQIWNVSSHRTIHEDKCSPTSRFLLDVLSKTDGILFSWEPNRLDFSRCFPSLSEKTVTLEWGLPDKYFDLSYAPDSHLAQSTLKNVNDEDILLFWPRLIHPNNRHDVLLDALDALRTKLDSHTWARTKVLLLGGTSTGRHVDSVVAKLNDLKMPNVTLLRGEFYPKPCLMPLYDRADIFVNLADADQITFGIVEACARYTAIILSDIGEYRQLEKYGILARFTRNSAKHVARAIEEVIGRINSPDLDEELNKNREICKEVFSSEKCYQAIIDYCLDRN